MPKLTGLCGRAKEMVVFRSSSMAPDTMFTKACQPGHKIWGNKQGNTRKKTIDIFLCKHAVDLGKFRLSQYIHHKTAKVIHIYDETNMDTFAFSDTIIYK